MKNTTFNFLKKLIYSRKKHVFYKGFPQHTKRDRVIEIKEYNDYSYIPPEFIPPVFKIRCLNTMYYRMKRDNAKLLCYVNSDTQELIAYGWIQSWQPFKRKFGNISKDAVMLGPYWTNPAYRGQGIYKKMLDHSLQLCENEKGKDIIIYTSTNNHASRRGIESVGFKLIGTFEIITW